MSRQNAMVPVFVAVALALSACGGDDDTAAALDGTGAGGGELTVIAEDISFPSEAYQAEAGTIDVVYENDGIAGHQEAGMEATLEVS